MTSLKPQVPMTMKDYLEKLENNKKIKKQFRRERLNEFNNLSIRDQDKISYCIYDEIIYKKNSDFKTFKDYLEKNKNYSYNINDELSEYYDDDYNYNQNIMNEFTDDDDSVFDHYYDESIIENFEDFYNSDYDYDEFDDISEFSYDSNDENYD